jgi:hypothetical protein
MKLLSRSRLASLVLLAVPVAAQGSILPYLPKDTVMAVSVPDINGSIADLGKMPIGKMWAEDDVQAFFAQLKEMVGKQIDQGMAQAKEMHAQGQLPFDPQQLMQLRVQSGTFAITRLDFAMGDFGPNIDLGIVLHLDFGASAPTWSSLIQMGLGMLETEAGQEMSKKEEKLGDVQLITMVPNDARNSSMIVANMQQKKPGLGANPQYKATAAKLATEGAEVEVFTRTAPIIDFLVSAVRGGLEQQQIEGVNLDGIERAVTALGLRDLGASGSTVSYVDGKSVSRSFTARSSPGTAAIRTIDTSFLRWVPKDSVGFRASTLDVMSIYQTLRAALEAYDPDFAKMALDQLAKMEQQLGFTVRDDLFGSFGDHYVYWSMPLGTISSAPEVALLLKMQDEAKFLNVLKGLVKMSRGLVTLEEGEKRGVKAYELRIDFEQLGGGMAGGMGMLEMFTPTFAFKNGYMVGGFSVTDIKRVFQRMDREDDPKGDIRGNKEFAAIAAAIPAGVEMLSFTDWKSEFESLYQIVTSTLAFLPLGDEVPINMSMLPDSGTLTKHLYGSLTYQRSDASGTEVISSSPFGPETVALLGGVAIGALAMFGIAQRGF